MTNHSGLRFIVENDRVETFGLAAIAHNDLAMHVTTKAEVERARGILFRLAAYIVGSAARLRPGDTVIVDDQEIVLAAGGDRILEATIAGQTEA